jgi:hypothetical protein
VKFNVGIRDAWHVAGLCGKRNFKRRRRLFPLAFFYQDLRALVKGVLRAQSFNNELRVRDDGFKLPYSVIITVED